VHPFGDLSAYLDEALSPEARASVQAHLDTCALCRTRLAELRGTARLMAALPMPVPSRSLVPRVSVPIWMTALRTFSTVASAAAIFLFIVSAAISSFPRFTSTAGAPAAAPAPNSALDQTNSGGATSASQTPDDRKLRAPSPSSPFAAFTGKPSPAPAPAERSIASDAVRRQDVGSANPATPNLENSEHLRCLYGYPPFNPFPWLWLVLGVAFAALSFILGRRLRSA